MDLPSKQREFEELKRRVAQLEEELSEAQAVKPFRPQGFYAAYYATTGFLLGGVAAVAALGVNMLGAPLAGKHPLELIRIYLTFPLGERALQLAEGGQGGYALDDNLVIALGVCLYLGTGMLFGSIIQVVLARVAGRARLGARLVVASAVGLGLWLVNFYGVLSWLQPLLFHGNWITDPHFLPVWVAAGTHLVFGWMMAVLYPLGEFKLPVSAQEPA